MYSQLQKKVDTIKKFSQVRQEKKLNTISIPTQAVVQRKLNSLNTDNNMEVFEGENINSEDIRSINKENYEETQVVEDKIGTIYYGHIPNNELEDKNAIILGLKTRGLGFNYYNKENKKSSEIAFSNKMALRGYINSDVAPKLLPLLANDIKEVGGRKGGGLNVMNRKRWYCPEGFENIKFKDLTFNTQETIIREWDNKLNEINIDRLDISHAAEAAGKSPEEYKEILVKEKENLKQIVLRLNDLIQDMNTSEESTTGIHTAPSTDIEQWHISHFLIEKGAITADGRYWAAKSQESLLKRLIKRVEIDQDRLEQINVYVNGNEQSIRRRRIEELEGKVITSIENRDDKYKWNAESIEDLGNQYAKVNEPRSHKEWLEIEKLWNETLKRNEVLDFWNKTSDLYLDTTGIKEKHIFINKLEQTDISKLQQIGIFDYLLEKGSIEGSENNYEWSINAINELGGIFSKFSQATDENWKSLLEVWNNTHQLKISYDLTKKFNTWNQAPTEWGINSTSNVGTTSETPYAGWSQFSWANRGDLIKFDTIRPQEKPHMHPEQEEIYTVQQGTAYLLERDVVVKVETGKTKVIHKHTHHFVVAIDAPYKHTVVQYPSGFHWDNNKQEVHVGKDYYEEARRQFPIPE